MASNGIAFRSWLIPHFLLQKGFSFYWPKARLASECSVLTDTLHQCIGCAWPGFGSGGYGGGFCEKLPESSSMFDRVNVSRLQDRPVPAKAESISHSSSTLVIAYLRMKKTGGCCCEEIVSREEWEYVEGRLCRHKGQCRRRDRRCPGHWSWDSAAAHACSPCCRLWWGSPYRSTEMQRLTCSSWRPLMLEQVVGWEETMTLWAACGEQGPGRDLKTDPPWTRRRTICYERYPTLEWGKDFPPWAAAETTYAELTLSPVLCLPCAAGVEVAERGMKGEAAGKVFLRFVTLLVVLHWLWLEINSINFLKWSLVCPWQ